jgi:hypothetical protein
VDRFVGQVGVRRMFSEVRWNSVARGGR